MALFYVDWDVIGAGTTEADRSRNARTRALLTKSVQDRASNRFDGLGSTTLLWQADLAKPTAAKLKAEIEGAFNRGKEAGVAYDTYKLIVARVYRNFVISGFSTAEQTKIEAVRAKQPLI